ncbi:MAG: MarR family transcriptional regulator [Cytophagales bacterium]|nr:MAG: MarR family transcriptional regulator [Cytophagales bacterium]
MSTSDNLKLIQQQVEKIGIVCDKDGFPPLAGRLLGFMILAEPPHKTFDEIVAFLNASKSAVSNTLKFLENQKMIDYTTFPGDRKRYFRLSVENWSNVLIDKMVWLKAMQEQLTIALKIRTEENPEFNEGLRNIIELYEIVIEEMPLIIEKWKKRIIKRKQINIENE